MKKIIINAITVFGCVVAALVIGGFLFGLVTAKDCDWSALGILGRLFIGLVFAILTPTFYGFPPQNEGGVGEPFNAWPYVGTVLAILLPIALILVNRRLNKKMQYGSNKTQEGIGEELAEPSE